jgi:hypothetical protein
MASLTSRRRYLIRRLFLSRRDSYSTNDAARLLAVRHLQLLQRIESGDWEAKPDGTGGYRLTFAQLAYAAFDVWTLDMIYDAMGESEAFPALLKPTEITLRLPEYQIVAINHLASRASRDVNEFMWRALLDIVCAAPVEDIERVVPGFKVALHYPD